MSGTDTISDTLADAISAGEGITCTHAQTIASLCAETHSISRPDTVSGAITGTDTDPSRGTGTGTLRNTGTCTITGTEIITDTDSH